jgi:hypothetical protein
MQNSALTARKGKVAVIHRRRQLEAEARSREEDAASRLDRLRHAQPSPAQVLSDASCPDTDLATSPAIECG